MFKKDFHYRERMNSNELYIKLENALPESTAKDRKTWAIEIIEHEINIKDLANLLWSEQKVALRFSWLLSGIGAINPNRLLQELPFLFALSDQVNHINFRLSFATYWLLCGIPIKNESIAIDLLMDWIRSPKINVTTKSRSLFVLFNLTQKYPELKNEVKLCLEDQMDKHTKDFQKRVGKLLSELAQ